jgi:hypothetical protein
MEMDTGKLINRIIRTANELDAAGRFAAADRLAQIGMRLAEELDEADLDDNFGFERSLSYDPSDEGDSSYVNEYSNEEDSSYLEDFSDEDKYFDLEDFPGDEDEDEYSDVEDAPDFRTSDDFANDENYIGGVKFSDDSYIDTDLLENRATPSAMDRMEKSRKRYDPFGEGDRKLDKINIDFNDFEDEDGVRFKEDVEELDRGAPGAGSLAYAQDYWKQIKTSGVFSNYTDAMEEGNFRRIANKRKRNIR